jgi:hypothetical protein
LHEFSADPGFPSLPRVVPAAPARGLRVQPGGRGQWGCSGHLCQRSAATGGRDKPGHDEVGGGHDEMGREHPLQRGDAAPSPRPQPAAFVRFAAQAPAWGESGVGHVAGSGTRHLRSWRFLRFPFSWPLHIGKRINPMRLLPGRGDDGAAALRQVAQDASESRSMASETDLRRRPHVRPGGCGGRRGWPAFAGHDTRSAATTPNLPATTRSFISRAALVWTRGARVSMLSDARLDSHAPA